MSSSTPTPLPPPPPENEPVLGLCTTFNTFFVTQLSIVVFCAMFFLLTMFLKNRGPRVGVVDYGQPWVIIYLCWAVALLGIGPIVTFFLVWHEAFPHAFPMAHNMACVEQATFPVIPALFGMAAVGLMVSYRPESAVAGYTSRFAEKIEETATARSGSSNSSSPSPPLSSALDGGGLEVLMLSSTIRGMFYVKTVEAVKKKSEKEASSPSHNIILADMSEATEFCKTSAAALGLDPVVDLTFVVPASDRPRRSSSCTFSTASSSASQLEETNLLSSVVAVGKDIHHHHPLTTTIPTTHSISPQCGAFIPFELRGLENNSIDLLLIPLGSRYMPGLGGFMATPKTLQERCQGLFTEAFRVLKPGGRVYVLDSLENTFYSRADLLAVGFEMDEVKPAGLEYSSWCCSSPDLFHAEGRKPVDGVPLMHPETTSGEQDDQCETSVVTTTATASHQVNIQNKLLGSFASSFSQNAVAKNVDKQELSETTKWSVVLVVEFMALSALFVFAAAIYEPLSVPKFIVIGQRFSNLFPQLACNFPMMAYFARNILLNENHFYDIPTLIKKLIVAEAGSTLASLLLSSTFFIPTFLLQMALNDTPLSNAAKSYIGLGISLCLGFLGTKWHMHKSKMRVYKQYGMNASIVKALKAEAKGVTPN